LTSHCPATTTPLAEQFAAPRIANDANPWLRQEAMANDAASCEELPLARLWLELTGGSVKAVDTFFSEGRCFIVTIGVEKRSTRPLTGRRLAILESVLRASAQKAVSYDLGVAASTNAANARHGLHWIGLDSPPSRVSPLLILAASAAGESDESVAGKQSLVHGQDATFRTVSVARPEDALSSQLPPAEMDIVRCLVEGYSHLGMARLRDTSKRTIANQIGSIFRRLRVTGRMQLIHRLFALSRESHSTRSAAPLGASERAGGLHRGRLMSARPPRLGDASEVLA